LKIRVIGGSRNLERLGIARHQRVDTVDLFQRRRHRVLALQRGRDIDRPELAAEPARAHTRDVGVQLRLRQLDVHLVEVVARVLAHGPRQIVVPVDQRHLFQQLVRAREQRGIWSAGLSGGLCHGNRGRERDECEDWGDGFDRHCRVSS
jgi:hypothetical protein